MSCRAPMRRFVLGALLGTCVALGLPVVEVSAMPAAPHPVQVSDDRPPGKISAEAIQLPMPLAQALVFVRDREARRGWRMDVPLEVLSADLDRVPFAFLPVRNGSRTRRWWLLQDSRDPGVTWVWETLPGGRRQHGQPARQAPGRRQVRQGGG